MKGIAIRDLPQRYQRQARQQLVVGSIRFSGQTPNMEPHLGNEHLGAKETAGFDRQVSITFIEKRHRLADPDGNCVKYLLDALVSAGILRDDSAKEIGKINKEQIKIGKEYVEETIIEVRKGNSGILPVVYRQLNDEMARGTMSRTAGTEG